MTHNAYNVYIYCNTSHYVNYRNSYKCTIVGISTLYISAAYAYTTTHNIQCTAILFLLNNRCIPMYLILYVMQESNRQQGGIGRNRTHSFAIYSITISVPNVSIQNLNCICNPVSVILLVALYSLIQGLLYTNSIWYRPQGVGVK